MYYILYTRKTKKSELDATNVEKLKGYVKSLSLYQAILGIGSYADKLILWVVASPVALAAYAIATLPIAKLDQLMPFEYLTVIKLANKKIDVEIYKKILKIFFLCFILFAIFTFLLMLVSPYILPLLFPKYNLIYLFKIVIWAIPFIPLGIFRGALMSEVNHQYLKILSVGSVILRITFLIVFGIMFKETGVAVGIVLGTGTEALMGMFLVRKIAYPKKK